MADDAAEFLEAWSLARGDKSPLVRAEAEALAVDWEADAANNGIDPVDLQAAAGGDLAAYLVRVFGEAEAGTEFPTPAS
jgi:hypothetical protein